MKSQSMIKTMLAIKRTLRDGLEKHKTESVVSVVYGELTKEIQTLEWVLDYE